MRSPADAGGVFGVRRADPGCAGAGADGNRMDARAHGIVAGRGIAAPSRRARGRGGDHGRVTISSGTPTRGDLRRLDPTIAGLEEIARPGFGYMCFGRG